MQNAHFYEHNDELHLRRRAFCNPIRAIEVLFSSYEGNGKSLLMLIKNHSIHLTYRDLMNLWNKLLYLATLNLFTTII
jgi:hypothetical protein